MRTPSRLTPERAHERYDAERRQGELIVERRLASAWGWNGPAGSLRADRRAEFLMSAARLEPGRRCLELGCGTGEFTQRLVPTGCELVAVDISPAALELCRERVAGCAETVVGNIETGQGLEGRTFDAIVGVSVLHHVNFELCLRNTLSLLEPGGRFAFSEPNMHNPQVWAERHIRPVGRWRHTTRHETAFTSNGLRETFSRAGLVVEVCEPFEFLHPATPRALMPHVLRLERWLEDGPVRAIAGSVRIAGHMPEVSGGHTHQQRQVAGGASRSTARRPKDA